MSSNERVYHYQVEVIDKKSQHLIYKESASFISEQPAIKIQDAIIDEMVAKSELLPEQYQFSREKHTFFLIISKL